MEDEEDAQFSGDESLSDDSDVDADESMDTSAVAGKEGVLASHLAFLAGAVCCIFVVLIGALDA
ncbi:hypothetical protein DL93DRAFT_2069891 [Clavulina sp. PMI_390]|nr:hypothetical protein DL93DRAFT_2069891 [Clavulina sp. PMI_390]